MWGLVRYRLAKDVALVGRRRSAREPAEGIDPLGPDQSLCPFPRRRWHDYSDLVSRLKAPCASDEDRHLFAPIPPDDGGGRSDSRKHSLAGWRLMDTTLSFSPRPRG